MNQNPFEKCAEYLAQGDIFALPLVVPYADHEIRIFRTLSGYHGAKVFETEGQKGHVYDYEELLHTLDKLPQNQRLKPFQRSIEGYDEMVVVYGGLLRYFVVASQTCDISGIDSRPKPYAVILPIIALGDYLGNEKLPIGLNPEDSHDFSKWSTIADYIEAEIQIDLSKERNNPHALVKEIRKIINEWKPGKSSPKEKVWNQIKRCIREILDSKKLYIYYIPHSSELNVPEGYIDFCRWYTLSIDALQNLKEYRIATIRTPYKEHFAQKLANFLSRIAIPTPLMPPKI